MEISGQLKFLSDEGNLLLEWLIKDIDPSSQVFTTADYTLQAKVAKCVAAEDC